MNNQNKTAVITGISSGIGLALAKKLLAENFNVIGTTRSGVLNDFQNDNLEVVALDATDKGSVASAISRIAELTKGIDLVINNAGAAPDIFDVTPEINAFNQTIATNITGVVFFNEPLLEIIKDGGQIVFISSQMGLPRNADVTGTAYCMSKAAINMYAVILAKRLAERNIKVTPVHPGWVQTKLGGDQAPLTPEQSAEGIYNGIADMESGRFYNITIPGTEDF
ncbi:SDR family NAD(P)-dependent oxidoreductase [uncultured Mucilaginibacter sp.]|uniref:SDR family NAD(P)-dependent oxidoreductase n=1 Tax=uncultured Mucilaginibacter sp. TaxID=797541 RepID=UPI00262D7821|nr:SDR family NAD(P)-dependent oxidoreductase [uncultured Mucilaginibacter sp.]